MAKFSLARLPYYIAVTIFMGFVAFESFILNSTVVGYASDFYLATMVVSIGLAALSVFYAMRADAGDDDEVDTEVAGLPVGKSWYYIAVLIICAWRVVIGYGLNHNETGLASIWGIIWVISGLGIALFTYANYRSYTATHPAIPKSAAPRVDPPWPTGR
jgi:hypothetical protein